MRDKALAVSGRVVARLARQVEAALDTHPLSLAQYRLLGFLAEGETASSRLAATMAVSPPSITAVVDGLVTLGLVERRSDATDRRRLQLVMTPEGEAAWQQANEAVGTRLDGLLDRVDRQDAAVARTSMLHWNTALDRDREARAQRPAE